jgi:hypothetical protein
VPGHAIKDGAFANAVFHHFIFRLLVEFLDVCQQKAILSLFSYLLYGHDTRFPYGCAYRFLPFVDIRFDERASEVLDPDPG